MLKKVKLYGELGERFGKEWNLDVNTPAEAIRALTINKKDFRKYLEDAESNGTGFHIKIGKSYLLDGRDTLVPSGVADIQIIPVVIGSKKGGLMKIIIGAFLLYFAFQFGVPLTEGMTLAEGSVVLGGKVFSSMALTGMKLGAALVLSGVAELLAPAPEPPKEEQTEYAFRGPLNTTKQGVPIPLCYGQLIVGSAVVSASIIPEDYNP